MFTCVYTALGRPVFVQHSESHTPRGKIDSNELLSSRHTMALPDRQALNTCIHACHEAGTQLANPPTKPRSLSCSSRGKPILPLITLIHTSRVSTKTAAALCSGCSRSVLPTQSSNPTHRPEQCSSGTVVPQKHNQTSVSLSHVMLPYIAYFLRIHIPYICVYVYISISISICLSIYR